MHKTSKHTLIIVLISFILLGGGIFSFIYKPELTPDYVTETVRFGDIESTVLANGTLQAFKQVSVGAQVSGQIERLFVEPGDEVKQGDLIAQIDSLGQQNNIKETLASLKIIQAQYRAKQAQIHQAKLEFVRQQQMLADRASSRADYEAAQATLTVYQAELEQLDAQKQQAEINVDSAKIDLGYTKITAPMAGTVVYSAVEVGQTVNANQTTPTIVEMAQLSTMTVKAEISEADVINVHSGQSVYFTILGQPSRPYHGVVRSVELGPTSMGKSDSASSNSSTTEAIYYYGLFDVDNPERTLRIGMTVQISIVLAKAENVLLVPSQILRLKARAKTTAQDAVATAQYQVPLLVNNQVEYVDVTIGINNKINAEIISGLKEGDLVVLGSPALDDGSKLRRTPSVRF
ncbi:efflux RND transporter periplasmic adaptor subunit [Shewanella sp. NKUCC01_JLK]|uniref:efflux RND transporter periplasmic adaptor subunit n=1 Tax=Shewanella sp. NKUCC01_JLK TaxID=2842123 RepID=UPI001C5AEAC2|nr:efflux RND transporter periplasmic adaptor subunit [Shewanella sp. NKUCC01_JLK]MBW3517183.1 efflux RND transporter periplasmic adaptor subunit [Shewanella sp. NKUCC01_JLK]